MQRSMTRKDDGCHDARTGVILLFISVALAMPLFLTAPAAADGGAFADGVGFGAGLGGDQDLEVGGPSLIAIIGRFIFAIAIVASLIVLSVMALRRYGLPRGALGVAGPRLELRAQLHLGPRRTIYLVRVDGSEILLGTAGDGLRLLTELPGAWTVASTSHEQAREVKIASGAQIAGDANPAGDAKIAGGRRRASEPGPFAATLGTLLKSANRPNGKPNGFAA